MTKPWVFITVGGSLLGLVVTALAGWDALIALAILVAIGFLFAGVLELLIR